VISILVAPLFYLIPTGISLCLMRSLRSRLPLSLLLGCACCIGFVLLTGLLQVAEAHRLLLTKFTPICVLILVLTALGWSTLWPWPAAGKLNFRTIAMALVPVIITYLYVYFVLYRFPNADLFQDVHSMKGAEELGRFGILSPYVTDSYIPIKQAVTGILIRTFGFDQLIGYWVVGFWSIAFKLVVIFAVCSVVADHRHQALFFVILSALIANSDLSNGVLCFFTSLLLMTVVNDHARKYYGAADDDISWPPALLLAIAAAVFIFAAKSSQMGVLCALIVAALLTNVPYAWKPAVPSPRAAFRLWPGPTELLVLLLVGSMFMMHRSSVILVPIAFLVAWALAVQLPERFTPLAKIIGIALPLACMIPVSLVAAEFLKIVDLTRVYEATASSFALLLNSNADDDFGLGVGLRNALIEWGRSIGPLFALLLAATLFHATLTRKGRALWNNSQFTLAWIAGWGLTLIILTGLPFGYRASYYTSLLFALVAAIAVPSVWSSAGRPVQLPLAAILACAILYELAAHYVPLLQGYQRFAWPIVVLGGITIVLMAIKGLSPRRRPAIAIVLVLMPLALSLDRIAGHFLSLPHSYGQPPADIKAISHYSMFDLTVADDLRGLSSMNVIISDPYSMSIVRARTGLSAIVPYSNLDTVNKITRQLLKTAIHEAEAADRDAYCNVVSQLFDLSAGEYRYALSPLLKNDTRKPDQIDTVFVFSRRTATWAAADAEEKASYFPDQTRLTTDQIAAIGELGSIISNSGDVTIAARVRCDTATSENSAIHPKT
jgi:hypothetical protein